MTSIREFRSDKAIYAHDSSTQVNTPTHTVTSCNCIDTCQKKKASVVRVWRKVEISGDFRSRKNGYGASTASRLSRESLSSRRHDMSKKTHKFTSTQVPGAFGM